MKGGRGGQTFTPRGYKDTEIRRYAPSPSREGKGGRCTTWTEFSEISRYRDIEIPSYPVRYRDTGIPGTSVGDGEGEEEGKRRGRTDQPDTEIPK